MPVVPRRNPNAYVPQTSTPTLRPGNAFTPPEPVPIGPAVQQIGRIIEQKIQRAEEVGLLEADNQLAEAATNLRTSALQKRGKDALAVGAQVQEEWEKTVSEVEGSLTSDRQREAFRARSSQQWRQLNATVQAHGADEFRKWETEQTEIGLKKRVEQAVENYADPKAVRQAVAESKYLVQLYGSHNGFSPEQTADRQMAATTQIHASVIARMVADGKDQLAVDYFKKAKPEITADSVTKITEQLEVASTEGAALRAADDIWKKLGPRSLNDPVVLTAMEQEARDRYPDNPKVLKATIQEIRQRREAHNADQTEVTATAAATVLGAFSKGASVQALVRSQAFLSLPGDRQESIKRHMLDTQRANANREPDKKNWAKFWGYSEPTKLASMSENQILSLVPELGQGLVNTLMQQKRTGLKTDEQVREASMEASLFGTTARDAGIDPDDDDNKPKLGQLRAAVILEIERTQQKLSRKLLESEKQTLMQGLIDQTVLLDYNDFFHGPDKPKTVALLTKDERGVAYVPIAQVSATFRRKAIGWMRQNGNARPDESETQVMNRFQRRLERAYGAKLTGASDDVIFDILAGK